MMFFAMSNNPDLLMRGLLLPIQPFLFGDRDKEFETVYHHVIRKELPLLKTVIQKLFADTDYKKWLKTRVIVALTLLQRTHSRKQLILALEKHKMLSVSMDLSGPVFEDRMVAEIKKQAEQQKAGLVVYVKLEHLGILKKLLSVPKNSYEMASYIVRPKWLNEVLDKQIAEAVHHCEYPIDSCWTETAPCAGTPLRC